MSKDDWRSLIWQMVSSELLEVDIQGHGGLSVTTKGTAVSDGRGCFEYRIQSAKRGNPDKRTTPIAAALDVV